MRSAKRGGRSAARSLLGGGASTETVLLAAVVATALGVGLSDDGALHELLQALRDAYRRFAYALSLP
jgi:hypothetical protein